MEFYGISGIVIIALMIFLAIILWKVSKILLIPLQIILFLALAFVVYKYCLTRENLEKLSGKVDNDKIREYVDKASDSAVKVVNAGKEAIERKVGEKVQDAAAGVISGGSSKSAAVPDGSAAPLASPSSSVSSAEKKTVVEAAAPGVAASENADE